MIRRWRFFANFFVDHPESQKNESDDDLLRHVQDTYNFALDKLLNYERLFETPGDLVSLLFLPYNFLEDLMHRKYQIKKKEKEEEQKKLEALKRLRRRRVPQR